MQRALWHRPAGLVACLMTSICFLGYTGCVINGMRSDSRVVIDVNVSNQDILELETDGSDYILVDDFSTACLLQGKQMASIGTAQDGMYFDGKTAHRYLKGEAVPVEDFPFAQITERVDEYLHAIQTILQDGFFRFQRRLEPEAKGSMYEGQFYYVISEEGLALFSGEDYANGLIITRYRSVDFQQVKLFLYGSDGRLRTRCEIGKLEQDIEIEPPK